MWTSAVLLLAFFPKKTLHPPTHMGSQTSKGADPAGPLSDLMSSSSLQQTQDNSCGVKEVRFVFGKNEANAKLNPKRLLHLDDLEVLAKEKLTHNFPKKKARYRIFDEKDGEFKLCLSDGFPLSFFVPPFFRSSSSLFRATSLPYSLFYFLFLPLLFPSSPSSYSSFRSWPIFSLPFFPLASFIHAFTSPSHCSDLTVAQTSLGERAVLIVLLTEHDMDTFEENKVVKEQAKRETPLILPQDTAPTGVYMGVCAPACAFWKKWLRVEETG